MHPSLAPAASIEFVAQLSQAAREARIDGAQRHAESRGNLTRSATLEVAQQDHFALTFVEHEDDGDEFAVQFCAQHEFFD